MKSYKLQKYFVFEILAANSIFLFSILGKRAKVFEKSISNSKVFILNAFNIKSIKYMLQLTTRSEGRSFVKFE